MLPAGGTVPARLLYSLLLYLLLPAVLLRLCWRARRAPDYARRWGERFGRVAPLSGPVIWVHAVSVGETLAAAPLIRHLRTRHPRATLLVTTTTPTGSQRVRALFGSAVAHCYAPYDFPDAVARFLRRVQPALLVIMETELWPNLLHACATRGIPVVLANARLAACSAWGYAKAKPLTAPMLRALTRVAAQTAADGQRLLALGLAPDKLQITGNLKFDLDLSPELRARAAALRQAWAGSGPRPVWLAASTHAGEDELMLAAHAEILRVLPAALLVLVPRHPERFASVHAACVRAGFATRCRSEAGAVAPETQVLLGDTMGELLAFCGAADVVFVGGSLVPVGGHNLIEPAAWGRPVLAGPHLFNFAEAAALLQAAGGLRICADGAALATAVIELLTEPDHRATIGAAARAVAEANRGALARLTAAIEPLCPP
ncbi:MAG: lipid IV(A) 3-deoxy-D-manno-octulosonic acid transferase [Gammaproteobacteria bacterium]|nr:lipid IV(A) 3-deoxy-D-manno-octulosonic acid transferase [Gammaproteobacteria bacterium]